MNILSIQSHVVYGYVGNKAATYPLQSMGHDVWPINTVQFSNHTGYNKWQGEIFPAQHIHNLAQGIIDLGIASQCHAILSGYMGSANICFEVAAIAKKFKTLNPQLLYLCDPVIGNSSCYVKSEVLDFFRSHLAADIITPNQFEAETLTNIKISNNQDLKKVADYFHTQRRINIVIITGVKLSELSSNNLYVFISTGQQHGLIAAKEYQFSIPPNGTGDLFSAVFLGNYLLSQDAILALRRTVYFTDLALQNTFTTKSRELKITSINYGLNADETLPQVTFL